MHAVVVDLEQSKQDLPHLKGRAVYLFKSKENATRWQFDQLVKGGVFEMDSNTGKVKDCKFLSSTYPDWEDALDGYQTAMGGLEWFHDFQVVKH